MDQLDGPAGRTSWMDQLHGPDERTSWTDQPWPVCILEDLRFSLYIVAASKSDEGSVLYVPIYNCIILYDYVLSSLIFLGPT